MKALFLAFFAFSSAAFAAAPEGFVTEQREIDFKATSATSFAADVANTEVPVGPGTGWAKVFGGIQVLSNTKVHYRIAGLFTGKEGDFPAQIERFSDGTVSEILIPAQAFRFWNRPDHIYDSLHCLADGNGRLECHQLDYTRSFTFGF